MRWMTIFGIFLVFSLCFGLFDVNWFWWFDFACSPGSKNKVSSNCNVYIRTHTRQTRVAMSPLVLWTPPPYTYYAVQPYTQARKSKSKQERSTKTKSSFFVFCVRFWISNCLVIDVGERVPCQLSDPGSTSVSFSFILQRHDSLSHAWGSNSS